MIHMIDQLPDTILIGVQTENGVEEISINVSEWQSRYGRMDFSVWATRPGEDGAYEVKNYELQGSVIYWYPDETDTAIPGAGKVEIKAETADKRKLSGWCQTIIRASSVATPMDPPGVVIPWVKEVKDAAAEAKKQADRAEEIAGSISGGAVTGAVRFDQPQQLTDAQKAQARANIGAGTGSGGGGEGEPGQDGGYYLPSVTDGVLTWQPSKADMPAAPEANIKGDKGDPGQPGAPGNPGQAATIKVGTVTTLAAGSKATVRNSGTDTDAVLDFGIPRGADGTGGEGGGGSGEDGGYYTPIVTGGVLTWEASKADMPDAPSANIQGPKGDTGDPGYTPRKGVDYFDGEPGRKGDPGYTPVKGTDYWTVADRQSMVNDVLAALPVYNGEVADA